MADPLKELIKDIRILLGQLKRKKKTVDTDQLIAKIRGNVERLKKAAGTNKEGQLNTYGLMLDQVLRSLEDRTLLDKAKA